MRTLTYSESTSISAGALFIAPANPYLSANITILAVGGLTTLATIEYIYPAMLELGYFLFQYLSD